MRPFDLRRVPLITVLLLTACGVASQTAAPTSAPLTAIPTSAPTTVARKPTPAAVTPGQPVALRDDITVRKVLETGGNFVRLKLNPATRTIYALDPQANVSRLDVQASTLTPAYTTTEIGFPPNTVAAGLAFAPDGTLYVLGNSADETMTHAIIQRGTAETDGKRTWTTLATTAPYQKSNTQFDHVCNGIVVSPDGAHLLMNCGSRTDHGEEQSAQGVFPNLREVPLTSAMFRIPTDRTDQTLPNDEAQLKAQGYLFADGLRNAYDPAFAPNGDLISGENGPDADYPEELNWLREGHHYGFPWRMGTVDNPQRAADYDPQQDGRLQRAFYAVKNGFYRNDPQFPAPPADVTFSDPIPNLGPDANYYRNADGSVHKADEQRLPAASFTPHRSPLGLVFDTPGALSGELKGDGFILSWGAAEGDLPDPGRDLLHVKLTKADHRYQAQITQLVVGFDRPIDAALLGNKLYVLDWGGKGTIWEVALP